MPNTDDLTQGYPTSISQIRVEGYKSIRQEQAIDIARLTILAGANSSGKSSIMQPLLLLKQTLEAPYDPGPLRLEGANVRFTSAKQLFFKGMRSLNITLVTTNKDWLKLHFAEAEKKTGLKLTRMDIAQEVEFSLYPEMQAEEIKVVLEKIYNARYSNSSESVRNTITKLIADVSEDRYHIARNRCFLQISPTHLNTLFPMGLTFAQLIQSVIHVPGLRGNPERNYPVSAIGDTFPGTFENYTASIIAKWQQEKNKRIKMLSDQLSHLGLTWKVDAKPLDDTRVEIRVGRTRNPQRGGPDMVSVADVGFGVSQTLPVLVALLTAKKGQLVYLEQPEIHLHPRAQVAMASILVQAAKRGVKIVIETHSSLLLLAIQTLIAEGELDPKFIKLHWFQRSENGETNITTAQLDEAGAFGSWPEDFGEVSLEAEQRYLDAAESKLTRKFDG